MNKVLIVIDVQKYFINKDTKTIVKKIQEFLRKSSGEFSAIYFTVFKNDSNSPLWNISEWKGCAKSPDTDICEEIREFTNHTNLFYKNILSAYKVPQISKGLKEKNISEVYLCGFDTDCCVLATAYDLFDNGLKPIILKDITWSTSEEQLHHPALQIAERNIGFVE